MFNENVARSLPQNCFKLNEPQASLVSQGFQEKKVSLALQGIIKV